MLGKLTILSSFLLLSVDVSENLLAQQTFAIGNTILNSYPSREATNVNVATSIGVTYSLPLDEAILPADIITVTGSKHGNYSGSLTLSTNQRTLIFKPSYHFMGGEQVIVRIGSLPLQTGGSTLRDSLFFTTALAPVTFDTSFHSDDPILERQLHPNNLSAKEMGTESMPDSLNLPHIKVLQNHDPSPGQMYLTNVKLAFTQKNAYNMILNSDGSYAWAKGGGHHFFFDFEPHPNGTYSYMDGSANKWYILDTSFMIIDSLFATNGCYTDAHEFRITPEGHYMIISIRYEIVDMSKIVPGGDTDAVVQFPVLQEFDRKKNLVFEWNSKDHFQVTDATHEWFGAKSIDFCHINSIDFDADSNILISSRNMDEITKIDRHTGAIIWRLGGKNNQFTFSGDTLPFSHQHAIRRLDNGNYTLFDNGYFREKSKQFSRAIEYRLDQVHKTATEVWEFRHQPDVFGQVFGYVQRLRNGMTFICWGACDSVSVTELDPENNTLFEMVMDSGNYSYRAYKYDTNYVHGRDNIVFAVKPPADQIGSIHAFPNPFTHVSTITFTTSGHSIAKVTIVNPIGAEVASIFSGELDSGEHSYTWDAVGMPTGMYVGMVKIGGEVREIPIMLVK